MKYVKHVGRAEMQVRGNTIRRLRLPDRFSGAVLLALVLMMSTVTSVEAGNWGAGLHSGTWCERGTTESECTGENQWNYVYIEADVPSAMRTALENSLDEDYTIPYQVSGFVSSSPTLAATDVIVIWDNYSNQDPYAYTTCAPDSVIDGVSYGSGYNAWCKRQELYLDSSYADECFLVAPCKGWVACHELGHTMGLQHPGMTTRITCMSKNATNFERTTDLDAHDKGHLKDCYHHPNPEQATRTSACEN